MKELWKEHRHAYAVVLHSITFIIAPTLILSDAETFVEKISWISLVLIGAFFTAIGLSILIEMEVDKRLKEKD